MAKGYSSADQVGAYLGQTLTPAQQTQAVIWLDAAEAVVDGIAHTSWLTGAVVAEQYSLNNRGTRLYLRQTPVTSLQGITVRSYLVGDTGQVLTAGVDYELIDPTAGLVLLSNVYQSNAYFQSYGDYGGAVGYVGPVPAGGPGYGQLALVSYTPAQLVPSSVALAAAQIVGFWLTNNIEPGRYGLTSTRIRSQAETISTAFVEGLLPTGIRDLLDRTVSKVLL
jgi:hypothetical protein